MLVFLCFCLITPPPLSFPLICVYALCAIWVKIYVGIHSIHSIHTRIVEYPTYYHTNVLVWNRTKTADAHRGLKMIELLFWCVKNIKNVYCIRHISFRNKKTKITKHYITTSLCLFVNSQYRPRARGMEFL